MLEWAKKWAMDRLKIMLPDEIVPGEPFWIIAEIQNGEVTGTLLAPGEDAVALFPTWKAAEDAWRLIEDRSSWAVRGLSPEHFEIIAGLAERRGNSRPFCLYVDTQGYEGRFITVTAEQARNFGKGEGLPGFQRVSSRDNPGR